METQTIGIACQGVGVRMCTHCRHVEHDWSYTESDRTIMCTQLNAKSDTDRTYTRDRLIME